MGKKCSLIFIHKSNSISTWIDISSVKKWINSTLNYEFKTIGLFEVCSNQVLSIKDLKWQDDFFRDVRFIYLITGLLYARLPFSSSMLRI